jgi:hypothetical protein
MVIVPGNRIHREGITASRHNLGDGKPLEKE